MSLVTHIQDDNFIIRSLFMTPPIKTGELCVLSGNI